jgi:divalent metal cation (Fe/Co/Zn/Cd) transporter
MKIYKIGTIVGLIYTILMFITAVGVFLYWIKKGINWTIFTEDKYRLLLLIGVIVCYMVSLITLAILLYILHIGKSVEEDW